MKILILFLFLCSINLQIFSQQNPPSIKWKKIQTGNFEVVFPEEYAHEGQRVANMMEHAHETVSNSIGVKPKPLSIFLNNRAAISNGYAALAPRRSVWYNTPPQDATNLGAIDWYHTLSIHEYRHICQYDRMNQKFTRLARIFAGDYAQVVLSNIAVPPWFWEGDAVATETALSSGGRGRIPAFDMAIRTQLLSDVKYSYVKAKFGSYKDYYPNHYYLGYQMVTHVRRNYGKDAWNKVIDRSMWIPFWPYVFSLKMKKELGKNAKGIYNETMDTLTALWKYQLKQTDTTVAYLFNKDRKKYYTNLKYPQQTKDGAVIALRSGLDDPYSFVKITPQGKIEKLAESDAFNGFSYSSGKIVWASTRYDVRWGEKSYSELRMYDVETGEKRRLTNKSRYFAPKLSPDAKKIVVVEHSEMNKSQMLIIDAKTGAEIQRFKNPENETIRQPAWSADGKHIVYIHTKNDKSALSVIDIKNLTTTKIIDYSEALISYPVFWNEYILFNSPVSGIGNIYAVDIKNKQQYQVTSRKYGAYNPSVSLDGKKVFFQDYNFKGYNVAEIQPDKSKFKPLPEIENRNIKFYQPLVEQEATGDIYKEQYQTKEYPVTKYNAFANGLNFHSWGVYPLYPNYSFFAFSNNKLNTLSLIAELDYNLNEKVARTYVNASFMKYFPVFDIGLGYGKRSTLYGTDENYDNWNETALTAGIRLPFDLSSGVNMTYLETGLSANYTKITNKETIEEYDLNNGEFIPLVWRVFFYNFRHKALRDINPRFGQQLQFAFHHTPFSGDYRGSLFSIQGDLYFPGFFKHHSIKLHGAIEKQETISYSDRSNYRFQNEVLWPRGYNVYQYSDNFFKLSANYALPLLHPDVDILRMFYIKRIRTNLFFDYGLGTMNGEGYEQIEYKSTGIELLFDLHLFNLPVMIDAGPRISYRLTDDALRFDILVLGLRF